MRQKMNPTLPLNPFHPEAVATYGQIVKTCEDLGYMGPALEEVHQYLIEYPSATERRYGAAIGLKGGHGSGKTHLLMWLAEKAKGLSSIQPIVLYAKADRASFADLYSQLMSDLSREKMQELLGEALTNLATEQVGKAKATEAQEERITTYKDLEGGMQTKIDLEQLVIQLQSKLDRNPENPIPDIIPRTLTLINNPRFGEKAYQWLLGKEVTDLAELNLNHYLFQLHQQGTDGSTSDSSVPDHTAIVALETVAALLLIAQRPLIVLVDQLEVLLRADPQRQQTLFSVIKKMVEQLNNQKVLTFIAGNNESWEILPPDAQRWESQSK
jgi:predicted CopG family antitoxin